MDSIKYAVVVLPVRAGDAGEVHALIGMMVERAGGGGKGTASVVHFNPWAFEIVRTRLIADDGDGATGHRIARELAAIGASACKGEKQKSLFHST